MTLMVLLADHRVSHGQKLVHCAVLTMNVVNCFMTIFAFYVINNLNFFWQKMLVECLQIGTQKP